MASNNPQTPLQEANEVDKSPFHQVTQPNSSNAIAQQQKYQLGRYWNYQREHMAVTDHDFKKHEFPLSRIKKIMKSDEDVQMVSPEAPILFAKACEFFIQQLTIKSWLPAEHCGRRTLRKDDIVEAINETDYYKFLFDFRRDGPAAGAGSSSMFSSHADQGSVASSSSVPILLPISGDGVLVLPPPVQRWIRYGHDENELNGGEQKNDVDGAAN